MWRRCYCNLNCFCLTARKSKVQIQLVWQNTAGLWSVCVTCWGTPPPVPDEFGEFGERRCCCVVMLLVTLLSTTKIIVTNQDAKQTITVCFKLKVRRAGGPHSMLVQAALLSCSFLRFEPSTLRDSEVCVILRHC